MDKEYIEREAVLRHKRKMSGTDFGGDFWDEAVLCEEILKIPKADVAEVKYGRWIEDKSGEIVCSQCGTRIPEMYSNADSVLKSECRFCHYCGAKMDLEV